MKIEWDLSLVKHEAVQDDESNLDDGSMTGQGTEEVISSNVGSGMFISNMRIYKNFRLVFFNRKTGEEVFVHPYSGST